jgi:hypothetical protein
MFFEKRTTLARRFAAVAFWPALALVIWAN